MERSQSEWISILDTEIRVHQTAQANYRNSLTVSLGGTASIAVSILAAVETGGITREDIPYIAPFFVSAFLMCFAVRSLLSIYRRGWIWRIGMALEAYQRPPPLETASEAVDFTIVINALAAIILFGMLSLDSGMDIMTLAAYLVVVVIVATLTSFSLGHFIMKVMSMEVLKQRIAGTTHKGGSDAEERRQTAWNWTRDEFETFIMYSALSLVLLVMAWSIGPDIERLVAAVLAFVLLFVISVVFDLHAVMKNEEAKADTKMALRYWIISEASDSRDIESQYRLLLERTEYSQVEY